MARATSTALTLTALAAATTGSSAALAQSASEPWQFRAQLYLWVPGASGETVFPPSGGTPGAGVSFSDYFSLSNLQTVFMATFEASRGRWGGFTDFLYVDFDEGRSGTRDLSISGPGGLVQIPASASADVDLRLRGKAWTLGATYAAIQRPQHTLQWLGGLRYLQIAPKLDWQLSGNIGSLPPGSAAGSLEVKPSYWDALVGVRGRAALGQSRWFVPYYLDVGTGESRLTWQAVIGVGYAIDAVEITGGYRYVGYEFKSGSPVTRLTFDGPGVSVAFRW